MAAIKEKIAILGGMGREALRAQWQELLAFRPPSHASDSYLRSVLTYHLQEQAGQGLSKATQRRLRNLAAEFDRDPGHRPTHSSLGPIKMKPGVKLLREWNGETHEVTVLKEGFEYLGCRHKSLSAIARGITGTRWSGPVFFGLKSAGKGRGGCHAA
jgi:hypothetical protein